MIAFFKKKLYVSADDATELNGRYAHGHGLMRQSIDVFHILNGYRPHLAKAAARANGNDTTK